MQNDNVENVNMNETNIETEADIEEQKALDEVNRAIAAKQIEKEDSLDEQLTSPTRSDKERSPRKSTKTKKGKLLYSNGSPTQHLGTRSSSSDDTTRDAIVHTQNVGRSAADLKPSSPVPVPAPNSEKKGSDAEDSPKVQTRKPHVAGSNPFDVLSGLNKKKKQPAHTSTPKPVPTSVPAPAPAPENKTSEAIDQADATMADVSGFVNVPARKQRATKPVPAPQEQEVAQFSFNPVFPDTEEFKDINAWYATCCEIAWDLTQEEAEQCVNVVLQMFMANPNRALSSIGKSIREGRDSAILGKFGRYAVVTRGSNYTFICQMPEGENYGVPIEQILKGFQNPRLHNVASVCRRVGGAFFELGKRIQTVRITGVKCFARYTATVPPQAKKTITDYIGTYPSDDPNAVQKHGDSFLIALSFGTLGMNEKNAKRFEENVNKFSTYTARPRKHF